MSFANTDTNYNKSGRRRFLQKLTGGLISIMPIGGFLSSMVFQGRGEGVHNSRAGKRYSTKRQNTNEHIMNEPGYLKLHRAGKLKQRGEILWRMMEVCDLCPRECNTERLDGNEGDCHSSSQLEISSFNLHFGEEEPLVGDGGSGTIFFTNCSLRCIYCINHEVSILGHGRERSIDELAQMMLRLQANGAKNINVVTPTHYSPHIVLALDKAAADGLTIPLVYNTSGYEKAEIIKLLEGIVDIYLPDFKYFDSATAAKYSNGARKYPEMAKSALIEMHRQVGVAMPKSDGLINKGLMIRHLVLPNNVSNTNQVLKWIAHNLPRDTYINLMAQYRPEYKASNFPKLSRSLKISEYKEAVRQAEAAGLTNVNVQGG